MAYITGSANSVADLLSAIRAACTANGWTLSGEVLHRENVYFRVYDSSGSPTIHGGTGIDGSNNLTGTGPLFSYIGQISQAITFPLTYEIFLFNNPSEAYVVVNYATDWYQWIMFGKSNAPGLPGTGAWYTAPRWQAGGSSANWYCDASGGSTNRTLRGCPAFWAQGVSINDNGQNSYVHHDLDGRAWGDPSSSTNFSRSFGAVDTLLTRLPNTWNGETVLLPFQVWVPRTAGGTLSLVADLKNLRHCRNNFHLPGEVITLGADRWKIYPWLRRNAAAPAGGADHSGTVAFAVRYDGP